MPGTSKKQVAFMRYCEHTDHPPARCPDRATAREFAQPKGGSLRALPERKGKDPKR
jgi:hypothetical protein